MKKGHWRLTILAVVLTSFLIFASIKTLGSTIREVRSDSNKLIPIHTSIGFSTIIEFQEKPSSAILGDQDSFKLEYIGNAITIKALVHNTKTNLFVFSGGSRFNFSIDVANPSSADYVVRIIRNNPLSKNEVNNATPENKTVSIHHYTNKDGWKLEITELCISGDQRNPNTATTIHFKLFSNLKNQQVAPTSFALKQKGSFISAEGIYLDHLDISPERPIDGAIVVLNTQWKSHLATDLVFEFEKQILKSNKIQRISVSFSQNSNHENKEKSYAIKRLFEVKNK